MQTFVLILLALAFLYGALSFWMTYMAHQYPRRPVKDPPDWGKILDTTISTYDQKKLEVFRVDPEGESRGVVLLAHGWSRNRDRMMNRARMFGKWGFSCVMHSAGDHGNSSARRWMNAPKFSRDMTAVMDWVGEPVILYGHSAGAAASAITAFNHPEKVRMLFLEGCYPYTRPAMWSLYYWFSPWFARLFGNAILFWMDVLYQRRLNTVDPARLIKCLPMPIMIIHGEKDGRFPVEMARTLFNAVPLGNAELFVAKGAGHSDSSRMPGYEEAVKDFLKARLPGFSG